MEATAVKFALGKLDDLLKKGVELYNVREEITQMQLELRMIEGFLQDADSKRNRNPAVEQWVNEVRGVAYRIEVTIDTFMVDIEGNGRSRFGHFSKLLRLVKKPFELKKLGDQVKGIRKTLRTIGQTRAELGITNVAGANDENDKPPFRPTIPEEIDDSDVVGLESDKDKIIKHLLDRNVSRRTVLSIVGIGGIGKTTLAKKVYESTELAGKFDCRIWLSISQQFNVYDLMRKILKDQLQQEKLDIEDNQLWSALQGLLNEKRYFIILDDVWGPDLWERLKIALPDKRNASRVLITSRSEDVGRAADRDTELCKLGSLNEDDSLDLLFRKAFPNREPGGSGSYPELNKVANELSKKCAGLPLALIVLGGILSMREESYAAWQQVNSTLNWHTEKTKLCTQVLRLSYADLPDYLKQCFLYFASFPEDHKISANHVIRMWIAEEFISRDGTGTMEDTAQEYLRELVQRCLVEVDEKSWNGNYKICHMHDLLRDMAIHEAKQVSFFTVLSKEDDCSQLASERVHRASLQCASTPPNFSGHSESIRSLLCFKHYISNYRGFRLLRVLTFEKVHIRAREINYEGFFKGLIHLRYLGFRSCEEMPKGFERIPFSSMKNLETVDCKGTEIAFHNDSSPFSLWNVPTLKHVITHLVSRDNPPHLPSNWDQLRNLQTLKWVRLKNFPDFELELEYNINLRTLGILTEIDESVAAQKGGCTLKNLLKRTEHLVSLSIVSYKTMSGAAGCIPLLTEGTRGLACHERIQCLFLNGEWARDICVLSVEMLPRNLTKLTLVKSKLMEDPMPILEKLQCLRILRLWADAFLTKESTCTKEGFPSLQKLELRGLEKLRYWDIKEGAMPRLSHLQIVGCILLPFPDLQKVPTLKEITIQKALHKRMGPEDHKKIKQIPSVRLVTAW